MLEISFLAAELTFTIVWFLLRVVVWLRQGRINWKREAVLLLMYVNLAVIIRPGPWQTGMCSRLFLTPGRSFRFG